MTSPLIGLLLLASGPADRAAEALSGIFGQPEAASCRACHPRHFREWMGSVHAFASREPMLPRGSFHPQARAGYPGGGVQDSNCAGCHAGDVAALFNQRELMHPVRLSHAAERAITCTVCHQIEDAAIPHLDASRPDPARSEDCDPRPPGERNRGRFHRGKPFGEMELSDFCGPCHQVAAPGGLEIERTFSQYLESAYPGRAIACTTCHMRTYGGTVVPGGELREIVHRHDFIGTDVAADPVPALGPQRERVAAFLAAAASLFVHAPEKVLAGSTLELPVDVVNSGTGHNLPAGLPAERRMWLEVEAAIGAGNGAGTAIFRSGQGESEELRDAGAAGEDPQGAVFTDRYLDEAGREVSFWWQAARIEERSLRAHETRSAVYRIPIPEEGSGKSLRLEVRLRFQACSPRQLRQRGLESLIARYPVFDIAVFRSEPIPVVERLHPADTVQVPGDAPSIPAALERVPDGGTVIVEPGIYTLERPLRLGGRRVAVRSRSGAEDATLRLREGYEGDEASVVIFDAGETRESRLEGFTISGGRGTLLGGTRCGGGILCRGSSPSIARCRIEGNAAADGDGGGILLLDSRALLEENRIAGNRAGRNGGGAAVLGGSAVILSGNEFRDNAAGGAGGGLYAEGELELSRGLLQSNQAGRGGGAALAGGTSRQRLREVSFLGNAAPLGGGLAILGGEPEVDFAVIAGNAARLGGGVYAGGSGEPELINVTITENIASQWGAVRRLDSARVRIRNAILFANTPLELSGEIADSMVDDANYLKDANIGGFPLFVHSPGGRVPCGRIDEPGCVPIRWAPGREAQPIAYSRWIPGNYELLPTSPAIDRGAPRDPPDPDDTRRDLGGIAVRQPRRAFVRGDADGDGEVGLADSLRILGMIAGLVDVPCADAADFDDSGSVGIIDALLGILHHFRLGPRPAPPFPDCGLDPTPGEGLGCFRSHKGCE